jgi:hypothetical protein
VRKVNVIRAEPDKVQLALDLSVGARGFRTLVAAGDALQAVAAPSETTPVPGEPVAPSLARYILK